MKLKDIKLQQITPYTQKCQRSFLVWAQQTRNGVVYCNIVSHWLSPCPNWPLNFMGNDIATIIAYCIILIETHFYQAYPLLTKSDRPQLIWRRLHAWWKSLTLFVNIVVHWWLAPYVASEHRLLKFNLYCGWVLDQYRYSNDMVTWPNPPLIQGLYSLSDKTSYRQISWSLEAARLSVIMIVSLWNLTGISAALLPRCLSNFKAIEKF